MRCHQVAGRARPCYSATAATVLSASPTSVYYKAHHTFLAPKPNSERGAGFAAGFSSSSSSSSSCCTLRCTCTCDDITNKQSAQRTPAKIGAVAAVRQHAQQQGISAMLRHWSAAPSLCLCLGQTVTGVMALELAVPPLPPPLLLLLPPLLAVHTNGTTVVRSCMCNNAVISSRGGTQCCFVPVLVASLCREAHAVNPDPPSWPQNQTGPLAWLVLAPLPPPPLLPPPLQLLAWPACTNNAAGLSQEDKWMLGHIVVPLGASIW